MSNLRSDRVELFSEGKDMAEEIEIDVINTVLLENEDYCDAAHLYIYSDADAGDVADETDDAALVFVLQDDDVSNILASLETSQNLN